MKPTEIHKKDKVREIEVGTVVVHSEKYKGRQDGWENGKI